MKTRHYVVIVILAVLVLAIIGFSRWLRPYDLETERTTARAAGLPLTAAEFPQVEPPADQNAVPVYMELKEVLQANELNDESIAAPESDRTGLVPKGKTAALEALLKSRPDVTRLVHEAVGKPQFYQRHTWNNDELLEYLSPARTSAKWIRWESILLARQGRYAEAVKHQALGFRIAQQASGDPTLISYLVGIACEGLTMNGFQDILSEAGPNVAVADAVRKEINAYHPTYDLTRCLRAETVFGLTTLHQIRSFQDIKNLSGDASSDSRPSTRPFSIPLRRYLMDPSEAIYLHWMTANVEASKGQYVERIAAMARVQAEFDKAPKNRPTYVFAAVVMPVYGKVGEGEVRSAARRAAVTAMADVIEYRARHGRWPGTLAETGSPVPIDPNTGKPVGYRLEGAGFVISTTPDTTGLDSISAKKARLRAEIHYPR